MSNISRPYHALSDESGNLDYDIGPAIIKAIDPPGLTEDMVEFAIEAADRARRDYVLFRKDHIRGFQAFGLGASVKGAGIEIRRGLRRAD